MPTKNLQSGDSYSSLSKKIRKRQSFRAGVLGAPNAIPEFHFREELHAGTDLLPAAGLWTDTAYSRDRAVAALPLYKYATDPQFFKNFVVVIDDEPKRFSKWTKDYDLVLSDWVGTNQRLLIDRRTKSEFAEAQYEIQPETPSIEKTEHLSNEAVLPRWLVRTFGFSLGGLCISVLSLFVFWLLSASAAASVSGVFIGVFMAICGHVIASAESHLRSSGN